MKKYYQVLLYPVVVLAICCTLAILSGALLLAFAPSLSKVGGLLVGICSAIGIAIVLPCLIGVLCSYIKIDDEKIIFPTTPTPNYRLKEYTVKIDDIDSIIAYISVGDGFFTRSTKFYIFKLKSGDSFKQVFYNYGRKNEAEIVNSLKKRVKFIEHIPV